MNAIAETAAVEAAPTTTFGNTVMDCQVQKIFYGDFLAVRDSHLPIEKNKIIGFIGPSGASTTTSPLDCA